MIKKGDKIQTIKTIFIKHGPDLKAHTILTVQENPDMVNMGIFGAEDDNGEEWVFFVSELGTVFSLVPNPVEDRIQAEMQKSVEKQFKTKELNVDTIEKIRVFVEETFNNNLEKLDPLGIFPLGVNVSAAYDESTDRVTTTISGKKTK